MIMRKRTTYLVKMMKKERNMHWFKVDEVDLVVKLSVESEDLSVAIFVESEVAQFVE